MNERAIDKYQDAAFSAIEDSRAESFDIQKNIDAGDLLVGRETEKAILSNGFDAENRVLSCWIPKSMMNNYRFVNSKLEDAGIRIPAR